MTGKEYIEYRINTGDRFLVNLHKDSRELLAIILEQYAALRQPPVSSSVSVPAVRVRFYPKDVDETFDGTVIEETQYSYLVIPDDNLTGTARWNKKCCDVLR